MAPLLGELSSEQTSPPVAPERDSRRRRIAVGAALVLGLGILGAVTVRATRCPDAQGVSVPGLLCHPTAGSAVSAPALPTSATTGVPVPDREQFPDRNRTGVPSGSPLVASGPLTLDRAGTVVDGVDVRGTVTITADDVVVRRSRVTASAFSVVKVKEGVRGVRIEDVEVDGMGLKGEPGSTGIEGPATMTRVRVTGVENGVKPGNGSLLEDSVISGLAAPGKDPHIDGVEIDGGADIVIRGNLIDLTEWDQTSTVMVDNYFSPVTRVVVQGNRLLGGGYTVYSDGRFSGGPVTKVTFVGNRMGRGYWGFASIAASTPSWSGNIDDVTGRPVTP